MSDYEGLQQKFVLGDSGCRGGFESAWPLLAMTGAFGHGSHGHRNWGGGDCGCNWRDTTSERLLGEVREVRDQSRDFRTQEKIEKVEDKIECFKEGVITRFETVNKNLCSLENQVQGVKCEILKALDKQTIEEQRIEIYELRRGRDRDHNDHQNERTNSKFEAQMSLLNSKFASLDSKAG